MSKNYVERALTGLIGITSDLTRYLFSLLENSSECPIEGNGKHLFAFTESSEGLGGICVGEERSFS